MINRRVQSGKCIWKFGPELKDFWPQETFDDTVDPIKVDWEQYGDFEHRTSCEWFWGADQNQSTRKARHKRDKWKQKQNQDWIKFCDQVQDYCVKHGLVHELQTKL
jgi:hypothetical protein